MKVIIALEDTAGGVSMVAKMIHNGINDHSECSIAYLLVAQLENRLRRSIRNGTLLVTHDADKLDS